MLFQKNIEPHCTYCAKGTQLEGGKSSADGGGVVSPEWSCRSFKYDPLKRVPPAPAALDFSRLKDEDFTL